MSRLHQDLTSSPEARQARRLSDLEDASNARLLPKLPREIRGYISAAGAILAGGGFAVSKPEALRYKITFTTPFRGYPIVNFSPAIGGAIGGNLIQVEPTFFTLDLYNTAIARTEGYFTFRAAEAA